MKQVLRDSKQRLRGDCRGVVAAELAIMSPFLILLLLVVLDLGLVLTNHQIIENAAREGARYSSLPKNNIDPTNPAATETAIKNHIIDYCNGKGLTVAPGDITITQEYLIPVGSRTAVASDIVVMYNHSFITPGAASLSGGPVTLRGEAIFRNLF